MRKYSRSIWAVVNEGSLEVCWTSGGSSTSPKLMVYDSERAAKRGLRFAPKDCCKVVNIYSK